MKVTFYLLIFILCLNASAVLLEGLDIEPVPLTPYNGTKLEETYNASNIVDSWNPSEREFYDTGSGLRYIWNINVPILESALSMATAFGTPQIIIEFIRIPWRFVWVGWVIAFLSGRDFMP
jgi:hypothetical protein